MTLDIICYSLVFACTTCLVYASFLLLYLIEFIVQLTFLIVYHINEIYTFVSDCIRGAHVLNLPQEWRTVMVGKRWPSAQVTGDWLCFAEFSKRVMAFESRQETTFGTHVFVAFSDRMTGGHRIETTCLPIDDEDCAINFRGYC